MKAYSNLFTVDGEKFRVLTINQNESEKEVVKTSVDQIHHIHILDRSGSMDWCINNLVDHVQESFDVIGDNDLISVIWFSSKNMFKTLVKGARKSDNLKDLMDTIRSTVALTCFSDSIQEAANIVNDLHVLCPNFNITLFTDGIPCGVDPVMEKTTIETILKSISDKIMAFNTVAFGNYCDENFLRYLTQFSEFGQFIHSEKIEDYSEIFKKNFEKISESVTEKVQIQSSKKIVYLNRKMTKMFQAPCINFNRLSKDKNQFFLISNGAEDFEVKYNGEKISTNGLPEINIATMGNFLYAYAYNLFCEGFRNHAMLIYGKNLMDKEAVDLIQNTFTVSEIEETRKRLEEMVLNTSARWISGKCPNNYIPRKDAHCVMDVLNELSMTNSYYVPYSKLSEDYERIGRKSEDKSNTFIRNENEIISAPFEDFTYNQTKLNLSLKFEINGCVRTNGAEGIPIEIPAKMFRTHTFIKDGNLNMKTITVIVTEDTFDSLSKKGTNISKQKTDKNSKTKLDELTKEHGEKYVIAVINFNKLPMINRLYLENADAKRIFTLCEKESILSARFSMLNYHINLIKDGNTLAVKEGIFKKLTLAQIDLIKNTYFVDSHGWYRPVSETKKQAECDSYQIKEIDFVFKGLSKLPSVKDYLEKSRGKMTIGFTLLDMAFRWMMEEVKKAGLDITVLNFPLRDFLKKKLAEVKKENSKIRSELACIKMATYLNSDDFRGFTTNDKGERVVEGEFAEDTQTLILKTKESLEYL